MTINTSTISLGFIFWVLALICFFLAVVVAWPVGTIEHSGVLLPLGLLFWCASARTP